MVSRDRPQVTVVPSWKFHVMWKIYGIGTFSHMNFHFTYDIRTFSVMKYLIHKWNTRWTCEMNWSKISYVKYRYTKHVFHIWNGRFTYKNSFHMWNFHFSYEIETFSHMKYCFHTWNYMWNFWKGALLFRLHEFPPRCLCSIMFRRHNLFQGALLMSNVLHHES